MIPNKAIQSEGVADLPYTPQHKIAEIDLFFEII